MNITILGSGALGYPLAFCNCDNCKRARVVKGKSIRKMASILINNEMIVDLGPDTQTAMTMYDKDMGNIKYILQTHIHNDHYFAQHLITRIPYMSMKNQHLLHIYAHPNCLKIMSDRISEHEDADLISEEGQEKLVVKSNSISPGDVIEFNGYKIKAIDTDHDSKHGSILYLIEYNNKTLFYATDTRELTENALNELKNTKLDVLIMDHTFGDVNYSFSHLNRDLFIKQINILRDMGIVDDNTLIYGTHISHDGNGIHEEIDAIAKIYKYRIAYDGMEINL